MWKIQLACVAAFAVLGKIESSGPPAGKCNTENIVPVHIPIDVVTKMENHLKWRVVYATDLDSVEDHETYYISQLRGGQNYKIVNKKVFKDKSRSKYSSGLKTVDNVLIEDTVDENGEPHRSYMYPLELTSSFAELLYLCSDVGDPDIYYRIIIVPENNVPSESEIQQLLARDRAIFGDSHGTLIKLPENLME